jgi:hypothetical protein
MAVAVKKEPASIREIGAKLANFRKKLAISIGQKKITQGEFGEMFACGASGRVIASYELGDVDPPASLLYRIWKSGNSIDQIFNEGGIAEAGRAQALQLYQNSISASLKTMDQTERKRLLKEIEHDKRDKNIPTQETTSRPIGKRKAGHGASGKTKKR